MTRTIASTAAAVLIGLMTARGAAQSLATGAAGATFEVASVKPTTRMQAPSPRVLPSGQFDVEQATLRDLIRLAYPTNHGQVDVVGGPEWVRTSRFSVTAKAPAGTRPTLQMLQSLLADRFTLKVHPEMRQGASWNLILAGKPGKLGPDLSPSTCGKTPDGPTVCTPLRIAAGPSIVGQASIGDLASLLSNFPVVNAPVVDRTGLTGPFDIRVRWRADNNPDPDAGPPIFNALEDQLGLKLERGTGQVDVIVIDEVQPLRPD